MTITFWCPDAPTTQVTPYPNEDPDFVCEQSLLPEIQLSNCNAIIAFKLLGISPAPAGTILPREFEGILGRLLGLKTNITQQEQAPKSAQRDSSPKDLKNNPSPVSGRDLKLLLEKAIARNESEATAELTLYPDGYPANYTERLRSRLIDLLQKAKAGNFALSFG